jgi:hypothetical protein
LELERDLANQNMSWGYKYSGEDGNLGAFSYLATEASVEYEGARRQVFKHHDSRDSINGAVSSSLAR